MICWRLFKILISVIIFLLTKQGQQSHFDIKVLRGYGSKIFVKNQRIVLQDGIDVFTKKQEVEEYVPSSLPYSRIVVIGKEGYITTKAIQLLSDYHINVIFLDLFGNFKACLHEAMSSFVGYKRRMAQYDAFRDPQKVLYLQRKLIFDKLVSQINFVKDESIKSTLQKIILCLCRQINFHYNVNHITFLRTKVTLISSRWM